MYSQETLLFGFMTRYGRELTADIPAGEFHIQPAPGMNTPAWIIGHLAIASDYALKFSGAPMHCPQEWHALFGPGSPPSGEASAYPSKETLLAAFDTTAKQVTQNIATVTPEMASAANPVEFLAAHLPTVGNLLGHLLTTHIAVHLGQLSAWRRLRGMPAVKIPV